MNFWDSSAIVPLLIKEEMTRTISDIVAEDRHMHVWWATEVECVSALARRERESIETSGSIETALERLGALREDWNEIAAGTRVRSAAKRLLRVHALRTADALQLAAASVLAEGDNASVTVISLDDRLRDAARREGFSLLPQRRGGV
ncbi:MAG TPA: type II toxin-antitoxin system VapC family toxin [Thermoanaerobaculia bacterium]|jgi:predicted nucleic acid-binding protein|nr:type II toxin-antitoxin system VapC family toxin [Thermoanaerobaculia bacterium]